MLYKMLIIATIGIMLGGCTDLDFSDIDIWAGMRFMPGASVHPLYEEDDLMFDEELLGTWSDESDTTLAFEKAEEINAYVLTISDANTQDKFAAYLVEIDGMLYLDISPGNSTPSGLGLQQMLYVPCHIFMKIEQITPNLKIQFVYFVKLIKDDPNILKHEVVDESNILVTASTKKLQKFLKQYRHHENLFDTQSELVKLEHSDAVDNDTNSIDVNCVNISTEE